jgi:hypothetical protein
MPSLLDFVLANPGLIVLPAIAGAMMPNIVRVKANYLATGSFFRRRV